MILSQTFSRFDVLQSDLRDASIVSARADHDVSMPRVEDDFVRVRFLRESAAYLELDWRRIAATATGRVVARAQYREG